MQALKVVPEILYFDTFEDFNEEFKLGKGDILVTNEWMYTPYVKPLGIDIPVIFQEKYGKGEPSDEMIDAIAKDMKGYEYDRIVAFGGGACGGEGARAGLSGPGGAHHRAPHRLAHGPHGGPRPL